MLYSLAKILWFAERKKEIKRGNTYSTRGANANDGYVGTLGMIQQFDQLMQHYRDRRNAHTMLKRKHKLIFHIHIDNRKYIWKKELDIISFLILFSQMPPNSLPQKPNPWAYRKMLKGPTSRFPLALADSG